MAADRALRGVVFLLLCVSGVWLAAVLFQRAGWKESRLGVRREWRKGNTTQIDENGDGLVDEEDVTDPKTGETVVRRDVNHDGFFDLKYNLTPSGVATNIRNIREKAPRR